MIGKLGNKNANQFDNSDVQKIVRAINKGAEFPQSEDVPDQREKRNWWISLSQIMRGMTF